jgi:hypothetical protein
VVSISETKRFHHVARRCGGKAAQLLPSLNSGQIILPRHDRLVAQICGLERRTGRSGKDSIDHAPNGHDDIANAVAGAAAATRSKYTYDTSLDWIAGPDADAA